MVSGVLSDVSIKQAIATNQLGITPYDESLVQPASIDVRLNNQFTVEPNIDDSIIDLSNNGKHFIQPYNFTYSEEYYYLRPQEFILASTLEAIFLPDNLVARVEGKSSLGRLGLLVHATAGFCDPGFTGNITLELYNLNNKMIKLDYKMLIAQLSFMHLDRPAQKPYGHNDLNSHYQGQAGTVASRYGE